MKGIFKLLVLCGLLSFGQQSPEFRTFKDMFPDAHMVRLNKEVRINIDLEDDQISIVQEILEEDLYLSDAASQRSKESVSFSSFFEIESIEAASFAYENGKYREFPVESFKEKDELDDFFYDDTKTLNFIYPNLKKGSKTKLNYRERIKNPRFLSPMFFGDYFPIVSNKVTIVADKNVNLRFKEFNTEAHNIQYEKQEKRNKVIHSWTIKNMDEFDYEAGAPSYQTRLPHIIPIIDGYKVKNTQKPVLSDVKDLYSWYYSLVENVNTKEHDPALIELVDELTKNQPNELEKVRAIYYWVQQNIKYVAFEYALGGFIPREANDVYKKKYGDCKDNSSILHEMLEIAGIKGHLTWIGTRSIPYKYEEVPTPSADNHMILAYRNNGKTYFLDATGRYVPLEIPTSFIQGKEALIENGKDDFKIEEVPVVDARVNSVKETSKLKINEKVLEGSCVSEISGYHKIDMFNMLESKESESDLLEFYNSQFQKGNNKFLIDEFNEINKFSYTDNFKLEYSFKIQDYIKTIGNEIYVNLNLNKLASEFRLPKDRKTAVEFDYKMYIDIETELEIPEGYTVDYIPENFNSTSELMDVSVSYEQKDGSIIYRHRLKTDFLELGLDEQKELNKLISKAEKAYKEIVILKKK